MKSLLLLTGLLIGPLFAIARTEPEQEPPAFRTSTLGITFKPLKLRGLSELLREGGYPEFDDQWHVLQYGRESELFQQPEWSSWMSLGYGAKRKGWDKPKYVEATLVQIAAGLGYKVLNKHRFSITAQLGMELIILDVAICDRQIDSSDLKGYVTVQQADKKSLSVSQMCLRTGLQFRYREGPGSILVGNLGYHLPLERAEAAHIRSSFGEMPDTRLGGFYAGISVGFLRQRCKSD